VSSAEVEQVGWSGTFARLCGCAALVVLFWVAWRWGGTAAIMLAGCVAALIQLPTLFYRGVVVPLLWGVQCPSCSGWSLVRIASVSFGYRFYECVDCGQRCKRSDIDSPWEDASDLGDAIMYKPKLASLRPATDWRNFALGIGLVAGLAACSWAGWLIGGERGMVICVILGSVGYSWRTTRHHPPEPIPARPVLWDRDVDQ